MNLRSKLFGVVAALILGLGVVAPIRADDSADVTVNLSDAGTFTFWLWNATATVIADQTVTTSQGATGIAKDTLEFNETRTNSPGWSISLSASDFTDGNGHVIPNENITLSGILLNWTIASYKGAGWPAAVDSNPYQTVSTTSVPQSLDSPVTVLTATPGRGVGGARVGLTYTVNIPAGTFATAEGTVYTSLVTVTSTAAPTSS